MRGKRFIRRGKFGPILVGGSLTSGARAVSTQGMLRQFAPCPPTRYRPAPKKAPRPKQPPRKKCTACKGWGFIDKFPKRAYRRRGGRRANKPQEAPVKKWTRTPCERCGESGLEPC